MALMLDYTLYLRDYVIPIGETHQSTDWEVATDNVFNNIIDSSYNDTVNLTSFSNTIDISTYPEVYGRSRINTDARSLPYTDTVILYNTNVIISNITASLNSNNDLDVTISGLIINNPSDSHTSTDWTIIDTATGNVVFQSLNDTTNLTGITIPASNLTDGNTYRIHSSINTTTSKSATVCLVHTYTLPPAGNLIGGGDSTGNF